MKLTLVYVYVPHLGGNYSENYPNRFVDTYQRHPTDIDHRCVVMCNTAPMTDQRLKVFAPLKNLVLFQNYNEGADIGAYQVAAEVFSCDCMMFLGASSYIRKDNWMQRVVESFEKYGPNAQYGAMSHNGGLGVDIHIRTTAFWMDPKLFIKHPLKVRDNGLRYSFEHGSNCLTTWLLKQDIKSWTITANGEYPIGLWHTVVNGMHQNNQEELLVGDRLSEPPFYPVS